MFLSVCKNNKQYPVRNSFFTHTGTCCQCLHKERCFGGSPSSIKTAIQMFLLSVINKRVLSPYFGNGIVKIFSCYSGLSTTLSTVFSIKNNAHTIVEIHYV